MRSVLVVLVMASVVVAEGSVSTGTVEPVRMYHDLIGIRKLERIKQYEKGLDFDGNRIGGGTIVTAGAHPYLGGIVIHLANGQTSMCGSSLLTNTRAVTAAHCWYDGWRQSVGFTMVYGSSFLMSGGVRIYTEQVDMHENWNTWNLNNDIAIVTHAFVGFNNIINRILLPSGPELDQTFAGMFAVASGYGLTQPGSPVANPDKRQATLLVITNAACQQRYGSFVIASTLCVSGEAMSNVCTGDSGGPLVVGSGETRVLIGVTSFGSGSCNDGSPSGFARVTTFVPWIVPRII